MKLTVISHENQSEFDRLAAGYLAEFKPKTVHEQFLVEQLAQSRWRLHRYRRLETLALEQIVSGESDETNPDAKILKSLGDKPLLIVTRLATAAEKSYHRAHRELSQGRSREKRNEAKDAQIWLRDSLQHMRDNPGAPVPMPWTSEQNEPDCQLPHFGTILYPKTPESGAKMASAAQTL